MLRRGSAKCFGLLVLVSAIHFRSVCSEELISYNVVQENGRTLIKSSTGEVIHWNCYSHGNDLSVKHWMMKVGGVAQAGVDLFTINTWPWGNAYWNNQFWSLDGNPHDPGLDAADMNARVAEILKVNPNARFIIRLSPVPHESWRTTNIELFPPVDGLPPSETKRRSQGEASFASDYYIAGVDRLVRDVVHWCEAQSWRNRIVGYTVFPIQEGCTEFAIEGHLFDTTPVMQSKFKQFIREKYRTDEALRKAWNDESITFDTVAVPTESQWREKRATLLHWPDPKQTQRERDYFMLQEKLFERYASTILNALGEATAERPVIKAVDMFKQAMQGWILRPEFDGSWNGNTVNDYGMIMLASGTTNAQKLIDHPALNALQTPGMYYNRNMGLGWEAEGLTDTLTLRGKYNFVEGDFRSWVAKDRNGVPDPAFANKEFGAFRNPRQMRAGLDRALAMSISRNQAFYYNTVSGRDWWFDDPAIHEHIRQQRCAVEKLSRLPWRETRDAICMVIDDEAGMWEDFSSGFQHLAVFRQLQEGLALCGIPYRIHLLQDLAREDFPAYKVYLFPNLYRVDDNVIALLKKRALRDGNVAIFGPGTGITDGTSRSASGASKLLGTPMELIEKSCPRKIVLEGGHPIGERLPTNVFGDNYVYGPLLVPASIEFEPEKTSARQLGTGWFFYGLNRPGLFINEFGRGATGNGNGGSRGDGDYAVVFSAAVPLPPELLRECARYAGCNVWCEENVVIYACDTFVALHTNKSHEFTINLPRKTGVFDFYSGEKISGKAAQIKLKTTSPDTKLFVLKDK